jgi:Zn-finger nucleic acid-binding protein
MNEITAPRACPVCSSALTIVLHEGVQLDRCPAGHGLWLDRGELREIALSEQVARSSDERDHARRVATSDAGHAVVAELDRTPRPCPVCTSGMQLTEYAGSGVPIDQCIDHGIWLDDGELEQIEAYAEDVRRQARGEVPRELSAVSGIDIPADLLATIRTANVPPPV